jgi:hypothetical protein
MTGINIQCPFSHMLINGNKCVETRSYPLPKKYEGEELALIETPGKCGRFKAKVIGTITFSHSFQYSHQEEWQSDYNRHLVPIEDKTYGWKEDKNKYGWVVSDIVKFDEPQPAPEKKGIVFTKSCQIIIPTGV